MKRTVKCFLVVLCVGVSGTGATAQNARDGRVPQLTLHAARIPSAAGIASRAARHPRSAPRTAPASRPTPRRTAGRQAENSSAVRPVLYENELTEGKSSDSQAMTLTDLQALATQQNPTLVQAKSGTWQAWGQYVQAGRYPNPRVSYTAEEIGEDGRAGNHGLQVSQQFVRGGKIGLSQTVAAERRQLAEDRLTAQQQRVANSVRREFYAVLAAAVRESLAEELVSVAQKIKNNIDERLANGRGLELNQVQATLELQQTLLISEQASQNSAAAWRKLEAVVGIPLHDRVLTGSLEDNLPILKWKQLVEMLNSSSPLIEQARTRVRQAHAELHRAEVQPTPDVFFTLGTAYQTASDTQVANLQVGVPLLVFNRNEGNITTAEAQTIAASREVERLSLQMQHRLAAIFRNFEQSRAQVLQYQQTVLPLTQKSLELSEKAFQDGQLPFLQWLVAQRSFMQTRQKYAESLAAMWQSVVLLEGLLLDDGLAHPNDGL